MKRTFKAMTSIALSALLVMQFSVGILADDNIEPPYSFYDGEEHEVSGGTLEAERGESYVHASNNSAVTVDGDVTVNQSSEYGGGSAIVADGDAIVDVKGDVTANNTSNHDAYTQGVSAANATVIVEGDVKTNSNANTYAITTDYYPEGHRDDAGELVWEYSKSDSSVTVNGSVVASGELEVNGIRAKGDKESNSVTSVKTGSVTVTSSDGHAKAVYIKDGNAVINGDVKATAKEYAQAVDAGNNTVINIKGNVITEVTNGPGYGIEVHNDAKVLVEGNVKANTKGGAAILTGYDSQERIMGASEVKVIGDVTGSALGITIETNSDGSKDVKVIVDGTVYGEKAAIDVENVTMGLPKTGYQSPTIVVGKLVTKDNNPMIKGYEGSHGAENPGAVAMAELIAASINYIIKADSSQLSYSGSTIRRIEGYDTAREGESFLVTPGAVASDLKIDGVDAGSYATVTKNSDGTFTVTVKRGGDLVLKLKTSKKGEVVEVKEEKEEKKESSSSSSDSSSNASAPAAPTMTTAQVVQAIQPAGSSASAAATLASVGITDAKEVATVQNAYNLTSITSEAGINQAIATAVQSEIAKVLAANFITINSGKANAKLETVQKVELLISDKISFTKSIADTIKNSNVDIVFFVKHNGQLVKITIKAGTDITPLLGQNGSVGPIALGNLLGTVEVTEQGIYSRIMQHYNK